MGLSYPFDMLGILEKPDGTAYFTRNRETILSQLMIACCLGGWSYWSITVFLSFAAQRAPISTLVLEMLLPIHWGNILLIMVFLALTRPALLEINNKQISWRNFGERKKTFPIEQLGWVYHGDMDVLVYRGPSLPSRKTTLEAVKLFSKDGELLTSISGKGFSASFSDISAYILQRTGAIAGAPPTLSKQKSNAMNVTILLFKIFGGYIFALTAAALLIYYA